ncbi:MAG: transketolase [Gammaproteobacteria bacterium]|nr:transketolase [Gammaproteobacteria bacterium]MCI0590167.1 transketolase [Gammaproteobacteria bacterium]
MAELSYVPILEFDRVRDLSVAPAVRTAIFATLARINTLYMITRAGSGHIGSSFSSLDIVSWLYLNELCLNGHDGAGDIYFSSKGHDVPGLYAVLTATGRLPFEYVHKLRRLDGLPGHPDISIPYIETNTGSLGMGISKAKGMAFANRLSGRVGNIYVMTGDGELQEGQLWESLASAANQGLREIRVIVDHNKIQSDTWVRHVSDLGDLEAKFRSFGWYVDRCNGHDLVAFDRALINVAAERERPAVIIADTVKGRGVSFMEAPASGANDLYPYHSGAPDDDTYARALTELIACANGQLRAVGANEVSLERTRGLVRKPPKQVQRLVAAYSEALVEQGRANERLVALDADLVLDCGLIPFRDAFPARFVECGIAEQDMVSQAGGMALKGLLPVVHSFACFLSTRANEQIYNNATEQTKIIYVGSLAGVLPGGPGHSHQSVRDIAVLAAVPGLTLIEPCCEREVALALRYAVREAEDSVYLRLVSIPCEIPYTLPEDYHLEPGKGVTLVEGTDAILFGYGPVLLPEAYKAAQLLRDQHGLSLKILNLPWLNVVDADWLKETIKGQSQVFTLDNHYLIGGQGDLLATEIAELGLAHRIKLTRFGIRAIPACGQNEEILAYHRLDANSIAQQIADQMLLR